jgi:alanine-synthesizing transaminase
MKNRIIGVSAKKLSYEIREIVVFADQIEKLGQQITWENIGDPVAKGEQVPKWIRDIVQKKTVENCTYGYAPTRGVEYTRKYLARLVNLRRKTTITSEDIIFFNGLGDAISIIYSLLKPSARIIGPTPSYPAHSSTEAAHSGTAHITYECDPKNKWYPVLSDLREKVKNNPNIAGILIINPNNPTGAVYPRKLLKNIVKIAEEFDLFVVADEIYLNIKYNSPKPTPLSDVIGKVCGISMKGISKEWPWPGSRCGWIEAYNSRSDPFFSEYIKAILIKKMLEVSSTTLPQAVIPQVLSDPRYKKYQRERNLKYKKRAELAYSILKNTKGIYVGKSEGAFYMTVAFKDGVLNNKQRLIINKADIRHIVETASEGVAPDKRFIYYLLGATGICLVPLSGFCCNRYGFRITFLENDEQKFRWIFKTVREKIEEYINSVGN